MPAGTKLQIDPQSHRDPAAAAAPPDAPGVLPGRAPALTLGFVGDMMLARKVDAAAAARPPAAFWGDLLPVLHGADAVLGNLECPITDTARRWRRGWKAFRFRAGPRALDLMRAANIRFVSLANNHMLDCEVEGLADTLAHLDAAGIARAGAGLDADEAARPALFPVRGVQVGAIALTDTMRAFAAGPGRPGTHHLRIADDEATLGRIAAMAAGLRAAGARIVVLSIHWGPNLRPWPPARYRRFARTAIGLGIDIVHGHSAHILQGFEFHGRGLILYDTGDILDDYWIFPGIRTDRSCLFLVEFDATAAISRVRLAPVTIERGSARLARGREALAIAARLLALARPFAGAAAVARAELHLLPPHVAIGADAAPALAAGEAVS